MPKKPTLFSDSRDDTQRFDPRLHRGELDPGRIEGYSEIIKANDLAKADPLTFRERNGFSLEEAYRRVGASPRELDVEFAWLPASSPTGGTLSQAAAQQLDHYQNREGFRLATMEDIDERGFQLPLTAHEAPDGTIRRGSDVALYVRSGEVARMWESYRAEEAARMEGAAIPETFTKGEHEAPTFVTEEERSQQDISV